MDGMEITYRQARREDLREMAEVYLQAFPESVEHYFRGRKPVAAIEDILAIPLDAEPQSALVAVVMDQVAGYCLAPSQMSRIAREAWRGGHVWRLLYGWLSRRYGIGLRALRMLAMDKWLASRNTDPHEHEAHILSIAVQPGFQGLGLGKGLLERGLEYLRGQGVQTVRLEVRPYNQPALNLYRKLGFVQVGSTRDSQGEWLVMIKQMECNPA